MRKNLYEHLIHPTPGVAVKSAALPSLLLMVCLLVLISILSGAEALGQTVSGTPEKYNTFAAVSKNNLQPSIQGDQEVRLNDILNDIQKEYNVNFGFSGKDLKNKSVKQAPKLNVSRTELDQLLKELLTPLNLSFEKLDASNYVIFEVKNEKTATANKAVDVTVSGKVTAQEDGSSLPGASIIIKGTTIGTVTDADGNYKITVPDLQSILVFSSIGYAAQEIPVNGRTVIDIALVTDITTLSEVMVIGYGSQKKADITGAVATFNTEQLTERPISRVDQALVGQMAGVRVKQTSGLPGKGFSVQIRGTGSITAGTEPLYVIDGFPLEVSSQNNSGGFATGNPLDNLNPNDIESITVLKDAAAGAIYGSRASNGVVLITTKKGRSGKAKINFNSYAGWNEVTRKVDMLNGREWIDRATEHINFNWVNSVSNGSRTANQTNEERRVLLNLPAGSVNPTMMTDDRWDPNHPNHGDLRFIDWQDVMFRKGIVQNYQLSGSGGNEFVNYFVSGDYLNQEGVMQGVGYERFSTRANIEFSASNKLKFGFNIAPSYSISDGNTLADGKDVQTHLLLSVTPVVPVENGGVMVGAAPNTVYRWGTNRTSPLAVMQQSIDETRTFRTLATLFGQYEFIKGLTFRTTVNLDNADGNRKFWQPGTVRVESPVTTGSLNSYNRKTFVNENTLSFDRTFSEIHSISILGGYSYNLFMYNASVVNGGRFGSDNISVISTANAATSGSTSETKNVLLSYFGRIQYGLSDKYLLSASLRRDGSSKFGDNTKWGIFPSVSAGWRISEESFMTGLNVIDDLKLRASWGIAGNNGIADDYGHVATLVGANTSFNGAQATGYRPDKIGNPNLSWEESETIDIGLDASILQNRIDLSFDYYTKTNRDLLLSIPVPSITGFTTALVNIGEVENRGWEAELTSRNLTGALQWNSSLNFSHNTNEVKKLGPNNTPIEFNGGFNEGHSILKVGEPMYSLYLVEEVGVLSPEDIANGYPLLEKQEAGDPKYLDYSGDGRITADDRKLSGNPAPDLVWGVTNTFAYKGFDLTIFVQGQNGGLIYSLLGRALGRVGQGFQDNALGFYRDRWRSPEDPGDGKHHKTTTKTAFIKNTDWLYSSDYWRVRNITLGYNLGSLIKSNTISGARVYVTAENFFGKDKYTGGFNPEAVNTGGEDYGGYPLSKGMVFGVNLTF